VTKLIWAIWVLNALLEWALLALVLWRKGWQRHLFFVVFVGFSAIKTGLLFWIAKAATQHYFKINWSAQLILVPLLVAVLIEVFASVFRPYATLPKGTLRWFWGTLIAMIVMAAAAAFFFPGASPGRLTNFVLLMNRSISIIFCGAFCLTALISGYFGIPWQTRTYGIGVGFLLFMAVGLFTAGLASIYGSSVSMIVQIVDMLAFSLGLITWIIYFCIPDTPTQKPTLEQARRLQKALDSTQKKMESLR
jgi:hypothetical protein